MGKAKGVLTKKFRVSTIYRAGSKLTLIYTTRCFIWFCALPINYLNYIPLTRKEMLTLLKHFGTFW